MKNASKKDGVVRDDNLRLIFAEVISDAQRERMTHIQTGLRILGWASLALTVGLIVISAFTAITLSLDEDGQRTALDIVFSIPGVAMIAGTVIVTLVLIVLMVERRETRRDMAEHEAFLRGYNRLPPEADADVDTDRT